MHSKINLFIEHLNHKYWNQIKPKDGTELYTYWDDKLNGFGVKAVSHFDHTPEQIIQFLQIPGEIENTSPLIEKSKILHKINNNEMIIYIKIAKVFLVASRDFLGYSRRYIDNKGNENVVFYSIEDPE